MAPFFLWYSFVMEDYKATDEIIEMAKEILAKEDNPFLTPEQRELIERILKELEQ